MARMREIAAQVCHKFSADYWRFFAAAFAFDLGTGLFLFLLSLYLVNRGFNEQSIGNLMAALTIGNLLGTLPAMILARRVGLRPLLLLAFALSPLVAAARVFALDPAVQLALAFAHGVTLCAWPICFSPVVAKLTTERNRSTGFAIVFATGIGMGTVAGLAGGWIPEWLTSWRVVDGDVGAMRLVLLLACSVVLIGVWPVVQIRLVGGVVSSARRGRTVHPFLLRFLPPFLLWNVVTGSFPAFGALYLHNLLGLPLRTVGTVFSLSQMAQCAAVLASPLLFRALNLTRGIAVAQFVAAILLLLLGRRGGVMLPICFYLTYTAVQFMCGPGIYRLLMDRIPDEERSTASAIQNACGAVCQAASAALTGFLIVHRGYGVVTIADACVGACVGLLFLCVEPAGAGVGGIRSASTAAGG